MGIDAPAPGKKIHTAVQPATRSQLRSVVGYTPQSYTIHYIRKDVRAQYTEDEIKAAIEELRLETLEQDHLDSVFGAVHGDQQCRIAVFENAIELNFVLGEGTGVEVAFDRNWGADQLEVIEQIQATLE
jgi:hypothetical protein